MSSSPTRKDTESPCAGFDLMPEAGSGAASASALPHSESTTSFVVVTKPLPTTEKFLEWVSEQRLPNARCVMNHSVNLKHSDEIVMLMDRHAFIADTLQSFGPKQSPTAAAASPVRPSSQDTDVQDIPQKPRGEARRPFGSNYVSAATADASAPEPIIPDTHWQRILEQFTRDLPRERFYIQGERISEVSDVFPRIEHFVATLPKYLKRQAVALTKPSSTASPTTASVGSPSTASAAGVAASTSNFFWGMLQYVANPLLTSSARAAAQGAAAVTKPAASPSSAASSDGHGSQSSEPTAEEVRDAATQIARLVALMSQQSVLAMPFEVLHNQYMSGAESEIFLGEPKSGERAEPSRIRRGDAGGAHPISPASSAPRTPLVEEVDPLDPLGTAMSVHLRVRGNGEACLLEIRKVFRVFTIFDGSDDTTLFLIAAKMTLNLFDTRDPVELTWAVRTPMRAQPRECDCLGASSGFHKAQCRFHPSQHGNR